jgi:proline dehydrogenase
LPEQKHIFKGLIFRLVRKHIAGSTTESMLEVVRRLNGQGLHATVTLLNDHTTQASKARYNTNAYVQLLKQVSRLNLNSDVSLRLTQIGYGLDSDLMGKNLKQIIEAAEENKRKVWIESEEVVDTEEMLSIYRDFKDGSSCLGMEIVPVKDGMNDIIESIKPKDMVKLKCHLHKEKAKGGHEKKESFDALKIYRGYIDGLRRARASVTVLDHNAHLIGKIASLDKGYRGSVTLEAPLGYGGKKLKKLLEKKYMTSVYVPYGKDWVPYVINRLSESRLKGIAIALLNGESKGHEDGSY